MSSLQDLRHVISADQFDREMLEALFDITDDIHLSGGSPLLSVPDEQPHDPLRGKVMASLFYESSTRTRLSFEAAMLRLGGGVIGTESAKKFSSAVKGESIGDTAEVISEYVDVIALRTAERGEAQKAAKAAAVPVINGGDGDGEHPTQALLDLYTIRRHFGRIEDKQVALVGDLKYSRTVHSLARLLALYEGVSISFISPDVLAIPQDIIDHLTEHDVSFDETDVLREFVQQVDVVYMTRTQYERHQEEEQERFDEFVQSYTFKPEYLDAVRNQQFSNHGIIMHPLPRGPELPDEVKRSPFCVAFGAQAKAGLLIRMALLKVLLS